MLILELSQYDFYTIDSTTLSIQFIYNGSSSYIITRMALLIDDKYDLHPAIFWNGLMDTKISGLNYDKAELDTIYDDFITNETFDGYVLPNYK